MATKNDCLASKNKQKSFDDTNSYFNQKAQQQQQEHANLNLNQTSKISKEASFQSHSKSKIDRHFVIPNNEEKLQSSNKNAMTDLCLKNPNMVHLRSGEETKWKNKKQSSSIKNDSTLSLHITAYENSIIDAGAIIDSNEEEMIKKSKNTIFISAPKSAVIQNSYEFPRQQEGNHFNDPEIMQFKASQRLFDPNQPNASDEHGMFYLSSLETGNNQRRRRQTSTETITDAIKYACEYVAYFFYSDPFIPTEQIERFTLELANEILKSLFNGECCRNKFRQHTLPNPRRECCTRSDEFIMEINTDGRLTTYIVDKAQSVMSLTPPEISDLLPDNTHIVISETYAFYSINHGPCVYLYKTCDCLVPGKKYPLKRAPVIRFNKALQCYELTRKSYPKIFPYELIPRIKVIATTAEERYLLHSTSDQAISSSSTTRQRNTYNNSRRKNHNNNNGGSGGHHHSSSSSIVALTPPKSAPPFSNSSNLTSSTSLEEQLLCATAQKQDTTPDMGQRFLEMVKARLV